jgi:signal-transduction protein with cAMP-binding, CBS, and nucleotidyltransferase domain
VSALLDWLGLTAAAAGQHHPPVVDAGASLASVAALLHRSGARAAVVADDAGRAIGLLEAADLIAGLPGPGATAEAAMQGPTALCDESEALHAAVARMQLEGRQALALVTPDGRPAGLLTLDAALSPLLAPLLVPLGARLAGPAVPDTVQQADLAAVLIHDGQPGVAVQRTLAVLNDATTQAIAAQSLAGMREDGWGDPPVGFALIVMGSSGRRESFLHPDQDNGLVLDAYPDDAHTAIDPYFIEFSTRLTTALDRAGFPLCLGHVMATNPVWRKTLDQWGAQIARWARAGSGQAVLSADIFLDFRPVYGDASLAARLSTTVLGIAAANPAFVRQISWQEGRETAPLGLFGQIIPDDDARRIDLKLRGTLPLVGLVRFMALRHGVAATGTLDRLAALQAAGAISAGLHAALLEDFAVLTDLRLRQQLADHAAGGPPGNRLDVSGLAERDRARLVQVFRTIELLRKVAAQSYGGQRG